MNNTLVDLSVELSYSRRLWGGDKEQGTGGGTNGLERTQA